MPSTTPLERSARGSARRADGEDKERSGVPQPLAPLRAAGGVVGLAVGREAPTRVSDRPDGTRPEFDSPASHRAYPGRICAHVRFATQLAPDRSRLSSAATVYTVRLRCFRMMRTPTSPDVLAAFRFKGDFQGALSDWGKASWHDRAGIPTRYLRHRWIEHLTRVGEWDLTAEVLTALENTDAFRPITSQAVLPQSAAATGRTSVSWTQAAIP